MGKRLVITEKPSVAKSIAKALGGYRRTDDGYVKGPNWITWALGHLVEQLMPDEYDPSLKKWSLDTLPFAPAVLRLKAIESSKDRYFSIKKLLRDTDLVVNACDAGREGELICRRILKFAGYEGPIQRLWISSYTDAAIQRGFRGLRPGEEFEGLYESARVRSEGDWIVGLNGTRALTVKHGGYAALLTMGRVQTPVLAGLVRREREIRAFTPEPYWLVRAKFCLESKELYEGLWIRREGVREEEEAAQAASGVKKAKGKKKQKKERASAHRSSWLTSKEEAEAVKERVQGGVGVVEEVTSKSRVERPPQLFDLTALQRAAHSLFRMSAKETLKTAQALYERHKLITYPRTDSRYLSKDLLSSLDERLRVLRSTKLREFCVELLDSGYTVTKRVVDDKKVTDHHALLPTEVRSETRDLSARESKLYWLIGRQMVAALMPAAQWLDTKVLTGVGEDCFVSRGKILKVGGWRRVIPPRGGNKPLPMIVEGHEPAVKEVVVSEEETKPPPRYTEGSLLKFMETAGRSIEEEELREAMKEHGLGTPATRAEIIEKLKSNHYIQKEGQSLQPTALGETLISLIPLEDIKSPELTGQWEKRIRDVQRDWSCAADFREEIVKLTEQLVLAIKKSPSRSQDVIKVAPERKRKGGKKQARRRSESSSRSATKRTPRSGASTSAKSGSAKKRKKSFGKELGDCPRCGEGRVIVGQTDYGCNRWKQGCRFVLRKSAPYKRSLSEAQVKGLLSKGQTRPVTFKEADGTSFKGRFVMEQERVRVKKV